MHLRKETIPYLQWAVWIKRRQASDHMILGCLHGRLGGIHAMIVRFDELNIGALLANKAFDSLGAFVVENAKPGFEIAFFKICVEVLEYFGHVSVGSAGERSE